MNKLMLLLMLPVLFLLSGCWDMGTTSMTGYVVKMDGEGLIWRTMAVKVMEGSLNSGHVSEEINVPPSLISAFSEAQEKQCKVKITYRRELFIAPWRATSNLVAEDIDVIE